MEYWPNDLYRCRDNRTVSDDLALARKVRRNYLALAEISGYGRAEIRLLDFGGRGTNAEYMSWPQSFAAAASMGRGTIVFAARYRICECAQQVRDRAERRKNEPAVFGDISMGAVQHNFSPQRFDQVHRLGGQRAIDGL